MRLPRCVVLLFRSGRIVITGAKQRQDIRDAVASVYHDIVTRFRAADELLSNSADYRVHQLHVAALHTQQAVADALGDAPLDADDA